jgi:hypothetical protein
MSTKMQDYIFQGGLTRNLEGILWKGLKGSLGRNQQDREKVIVNTSKDIIPGLTNSLDFAVIRAFVFPLAESSTQPMVIVYDLRAAQVPEIVKADDSSSPNWYNASEFNDYFFKIPPISYVLTTEKGAGQILSMMADHTPGKPGCVYRENLLDHNIVVVRPSIDLSSGTEEEIAKERASFFCTADHLMRDKGHHPIPNDSEMYNLVRSKLERTVQGKYSLSGRYPHHPDNDFCLVSTANGERFSRVSPPIFLAKIS